MHRNVDTLSPVTPFPFRLNCKIQMAETYTEILQRMSFATPIVNHSLTHSLIKMKS